MINPLEAAHPDSVSAAHLNGREVRHASTRRRLPKESEGASLEPRILLGLDHHVGWVAPLARDEELGAEQRRNGQFMAVLSHELRNSLCAIGNAARVLRLDQSAAPASIKARLLIERQVEQMNRLVADLMDMAQIRSGHLRLECSIVDLRELLAQALQAVELTLQQRGHRIKASLPAAPVWLEGDLVRLQQIFVNLLVNAAKYTAPGGDISLSLECQHDEAIVRIRDSGIGISAEMLPKVFDMFVQADETSQRAVAGLGIGLALVRSLVEGHGGTVSATSAGLGQGSEFTVRLRTPTTLERDVLGNS